MSTQSAPRNNATNIIRPLLIYSAPIILTGSIAWFFMRKFTSKGSQVSKPAEYWIGGDNGLDRGMGRWNPTTNQWEKSRDANAKIPDIHWRDAETLVVRFHIGSDTVELYVPRALVGDITSVSINDSGDTLYLHRFGIEVVYERASSAQNTLSTWRFATKHVHATKENGDKLHVWYPEEMPTSTDENTAVAEESEEDGFEIDGEKVVFSSVSHTNATQSENHTNSSAARLVHTLLECNKFQPLTT